VRIQVLRSVLMFLLVLLGSTSVFSQNQPPQSNPQALSLAHQSIAALTNGNATWIAGSDNELGSATLQAKGTGESRIDLNVSGGTRREIRNDGTGFPQGESIAPNGSVRAWAQHNCWTSASWVLPALSVLSPFRIQRYVTGNLGLDSSVAIVQFNSGLSDN
jgi:hypothetical protein